MIFIYFPVGSRRCTNSRRGDGSSTLSSKMVFTPSRANPKKVVQLKVRMPERPGGSVTPLNHANIRNPAEDSDGNVTSDDGDGKVRVAQLGIDSKSNESVTAAVDDINISPQGSAPVWKSCAASTSKSANRKLRAKTKKDGGSRKATTTISKPSGNGSMGSRRKARLNTSNSTIFCIKFF